MVPAYSHKVSRVSWYSGYRHVNQAFTYGAFTLSGRLSQNRSVSPLESIMRSKPQNARILVWALSISLAATLEIDVSFSSSGYLDVSVHRVPFHTLWIGVWILEVCSSGSPHSDISGSMGICPSPKLFAAYHVFHRLLVPRHPPCALSSITNMLLPMGMGIGDTHLAWCALAKSGLFFEFVFSNCVSITFVMNPRMSFLKYFYLRIDYIFVCGFQGTLHDR